jgi:hypothetical protein
MFWELPSLVVIIAFPGEAATAPPYRNLEGAVTELFELAELWKSWPARLTRL